MSSRPPLPRLALQPQSPSAAQSILVGASLLLLMSWLAAWVFGWDQAQVLAATLVIVVVGLLAIAARTLGADTARAGVPTPARSVASGAAPVDGQSTPAGDPSPLHGKRWSLDVFTHIDAQRFAAVCETWFSWAGFDTRHESHRTQEGVDIWLHAPRLPGPVAIVRCKHAPDKPVGLQELREFQGVVSTCKDAHGTFTTTSTYTPEALQFAKDHGIEVVDGRALLRRILTRTRQSQQALLAIAYHGR